MSGSRLSTREEKWNTIRTHSQSLLRICKPVTQVFDRLYIRLPRQPRKANPRSHITSNTGYILYVRWEGKMEILNPAPNPNNDHRCFCSGRRFACLGALFSLFLIASIPLIAQSGSSAPPADPP